MDVKALFEAWANNLTYKISVIENANADLQKSVDTLNQQVTDDQSKITLLTSTVKDQADIIADLNTKSKPKQYFGFVGHFYDSPIYKDVPQSIAIAKPLGFNATRTSPPLKPDGSFVNQTDFVSRVYWPLKAAGYEIFMLVDTEGLSPTSTDIKDQYNKGYAVFNGVVNNCGTCVHSYELGNELALKCILSTKDGRKKTDYDPAKIAAIGNYLKGAYDGVKAANPNVKTMLNCEWIHYGFVDAMLQDYGVDVDIISWHWYVGSPMQDNMFKTYTWANGQDIEDFLSNRYTGKQIIFNEVGYQSPKLPYDEDKAVAQLVPVVKRLLDKGFSVFIYQLFNQDEKAASSVLESSYGLFNGDLSPKKIVAGLQDLKR